MALIYTSSITVVALVSDPLPLVAVAVVNDCVTV